jgi:lysozyme
MPNNLSLSGAGLQKLIAHEGSIDGLYDDPAGYATFGVGHLVHQGHKAKSILLHTAQADGLCTSRVKTRWPGTSYATPYLEREAVASTDFGTLTAKASGRALDIVAQAMHKKAYKDLPADKTRTVKAAADAAVQEEARLLRHTVADILARDVKPFEKAVNELVTGVALTQDEFDALVSFAFNVGAAAFKRSNLLKRINENAFRTGDAAGRERAIAEIDKAFMAWNTAGGKVVSGLTRRRRDEADCFLGGARQAVKSVKVQPPPGTPVPKAPAAAPIRRVP